MPNLTALRALMTSSAANAGETALLDEFRKNWRQPSLTLLSCSLLFLGALATWTRWRATSLASTGGREVQLVSKISNLCGPDPPTSRTDKQTDGQTTCDRNIALCTKVHRAARGKNIDTVTILKNWYGPISSANCQFPRISRQIYGLTSILCFV